jgi:hypothetical protein
MNCNKCGTPILPGENSCRFCGTVGDYSKRNYEQVKPEIIDFTTGEDDVVIINDEPEKVDSFPLEKKLEVNENADIAPINFGSFSDPVTFNNDTIDQPVIVPNFDEDPISIFNTAPAVAPVDNYANQIEEMATTMPVVTPIASEPIPAVTPIADEPTTGASEEQIISFSTPTFGDVAQTETASEISVFPSDSSSEPSAVAASAPIIVTKNNSKEETNELIKEIMPTNEDGKKELKDKKSSHGVFNIATFVLAVLLIISVVGNCFLLMGTTKNNKEVTNTPVVSSTNQTAYFSGYKIEIPSNWITVTNKDLNYITLMDSTENWATTLSIATNVTAGKISDPKNVENITKAFGANKYLFTSDYSKTVDGKDFYIFKGKYYDYSVYLITTNLDATSTVVADLKFKGEVDDNVVNGVLNSLKTLSVKDLTNFYKNDFNFGDISGLVVNSIGLPNTQVTPGNY